MWYTYESDFNTISDSIEELSELCLENGLKKETKIKICGWKKEKINVEQQSEVLIDYILQQFDEAYSDVNEDKTQPTERMKKAVFDCLTVISEEYDVKTVEKVFEREFTL